MMAAGLGSTWWQYLLLFLAVAASWAGVPLIGTAALGAAAVAASQGRLDLGAVIVVAAIAGEAGGLGGYAIGRRWGRRLLERPGRHHARREKMVERGEKLYARWGWLAVFFTPAIVSGTAKIAAVSVRLLESPRLPRLGGVCGSQRLRGGPARHGPPHRARYRHHGHRARRWRARRFRRCAPSPKAHSPACSCHRQRAARSPLVTR
jgi:membrane protein YqaA with SNARE-associated domain